MSFELYRNNRVVHTDLGYPLKLVDKITLPDQAQRLDAGVLFSDKFYAYSRPDYLFCIDVVERKVVWDKQSESDISWPGWGDRDRVYLTFGDKASCLNCQTGEMIWQFGEEEAVIGATPRGIISRNATIRPEVVTCREKDTGDTLWTLQGKKEYKYLSAVASDNSSVILQKSGGIQVCDELTGEVGWEASYKEWFERVLPFEYSPDYTVPGPVVDGILYLGFGKPGMIAALRADSGELVWFYEYGEENCPQDIIYNDGKIYFRNLQVRLPENFLTCLDATNGELLLRTEENFTPAGCQQIISSGSYLITGLEQYLSFFDLATNEFVWCEKQQVEITRICLHKDFLIAYNADKKEIYWYAEE